MTAKGDGRGSQIEELMTTTARQAETPGIVKDRPVTLGVITGPTTPRISSPQAEPSSGYLSLALRTTFTLPMGQSGTKIIESNQNVSIMPSFDMAVACQTACDAATTPPLLPDPTVTDVSSPTKPKFLSVQSAPVPGISKKGGKQLEANSSNTKGSHCCTQPIPNPPLG